MPENIIVSVQNLTKSYHNGIIRALDNVNLNIRAGELAAIVGPSGSGKSTLLNLIGTLDTPTSGTITIHGKDISQLRGDALADFRRAQIGFIFQAFHLVPTLSALENVILPLLPYQRQCDFDVKTRANELLDRVGLKNRWQHVPAQLSGGEQQRVATARALINMPAILLADEPTGNLDSRTGAEIISLLQFLNAEYNLTILIATHDSVITHCARRVIPLQDGRVINSLSQPSNSNVSLQTKR